MATLTSKIARNTLLQVGGRAVGTLLGLFSLAILTRYLGTTGYGGFTTVTSFLQFFGILVDFGLTLTAVQMISEKDADEPGIIGNIMSLRIISAIIFFGLAPIVVLFFPYPEIVKIGVAVGSLAFAGMTLSQVLVGVFQKYLHMERVALAEIAGRAMLLIGIALAAWLNAGLVATIWALVAGNAVQLFIMIIASRRLIPFKLTFNAKLIKKIISQSWPIGVSIAFNLVYLKGDVVVLSIFRGQSEVGLYGAAYKVLDVITVIPMMFMGLVLPILVQAWSAHDHELFKKRLQKAFDFSALLALPIIGGTMILGTPIMKLVAGSDFSGSGNLMKILIIAAGAVFFSSLYGHTVIAIGKQRQSIWAYAVTALLTFAAYFIFIPKFGASAAAWGTVFSESLIAIILFGIIIKTTRAYPKLSTSLRALLATLCMTGTVYLFRGLPVLLPVLIGAISYLVFLFVFRAISLGTIKEFFLYK